MKDEKNKPSIANVVGAAGAAVAAGLVAREAPGAAGVVLSGVVGAALAEVQKVLKSRRDDRRQQWTLSILQGLNGETLDQAAQKLSEMAIDPNVQEALIQCASELDQALDDAVVAPLGVLTSFYIRTSRKPDRFFRGFSRLLRELDAQELEMLRWIAQNATERPGTQDPVDVFIDRGNGNLYVRVWAGPGVELGIGQVELTPPVSARPLLHSLKVHGLVIEEIAGPINSRGGPDVAAIRRKVAEEMHRILDSSLGTT